MGIGKFSRKKKNIKLIHYGQYDECKRMRRNACIIFNELEKENRRISVEANMGRKEEEEGFDNYFYNTINR